MITRYRPAQPGLLTGLAPGDSCSAKIAVEVSDLSDPDDVSHKGARRHLQLSRRLQGDHARRGVRCRPDPMDHKARSGRPRSRTPNTASSPRTSACSPASTSSRSPRSWLPKPYQVRQSARPGQQAPARRRRARSPWRPRRDCRRPKALVRRVRRAPAARATLLELRSGFRPSRGRSG